MVLPISVVLLLMHLFLIAVVYDHHHTHYDNEYSGIYSTKSTANDFVISILVTAFSVDTTTTKSATSLQYKPHHCHFKRRLQQQLFKTSDFGNDDDCREYQKTLDRNDSIDQQHSPVVGSSSLLEYILRHSDGIGRSNIITHNGHDRKSSSTQLSFSQERLITIPINTISSSPSNNNSNNVMLWAEIYMSKKCVLGQIISVITPPSNATQQRQQPKLQVQLFPTGSTTGDDEGNTQNNTTMIIVDIGQITTIWYEKVSDYCNYESKTLDDRQNKNQWYTNFDATTIAAQYIDSHSKQIEQVLDKFHQQRCRQRNTGTGTGTASSNSRNSKTIIQQLIQEATEQYCKDFRNISSNGQIVEQQEYTTMVLQKIYKTGINYQRIIDSSILVQQQQFLQFPKIAKATEAQWLTDNDENIDRTATSKAKQHRLRNRAIAAYILSNDAEHGGRLKRWPCIYVSTSSSSLAAAATNSDGSSTTSHNTISIINGGWFITDQAVRTGTEARKFVERTVGSGSALRHDTFGSADPGNKNYDDDGATSSFINEKTKVKVPMTLADERIFRRLECLAMGELIDTVTEKSTIRRRTERQPQKSQQQQQQQQQQELEFDLREVLRTMNLPFSPNGAKQALLQTGYWSNDDVSKHISLAKLIQPWSKSILEASKWYTETCLRNNRLDSTVGSIDLTQLPCVCIDAKTTSFRDDAIGVRLRSSTGRTVTPEASKWEILIHITDVSDLYTIFPHGNNIGKESINSSYISHGNVSTSFSDEQGQHYLTILRNAAASRGSSRYDLPFGPLHLLPPVVLKSLSFPTTTAMNTDPTGSRCVTIWAYIDERGGQLLDCGIERTTISSPIILNFAEATNLLDSKNTTTTTYNNKRQKAAQAILMVVERNLKLWDDNQRRYNNVAQKREIRLVAREERSLSTLPQRRPAQSTRQQQERDDGVDGFRRTRGHRIVDMGLNLYTMVAVDLVRQHINPNKNKSVNTLPIPRSIGADYETRGGRVGTAPLRRYIDGQVQRQLLALLCNYGIPMTIQECIDVSTISNQANNAMNNVRAIRSKTYN